MSSSVTQKQLPKPENISVRGYDDKAARLEYACQMITEIAGIIAPTNSATLVYLLQMAALEAEECVRAHEFRTEMVS